MSQSLTLFSFYFFVCLHSVKPFSFFTQKLHLSVHESYRRGINFLVSFKEHFSLNNLFSFMRVQCAKPLLFLKKNFLSELKIKFVYICPYGTNILNLLQLALTLKW